MDVPENTIVTKLLSAGLSSPVILSGYAAASTSNADKTKKTRIIHALGNLAEWTEVPNDAIVHFVQGPTELDPTTFFIKPDASLTHNDAKQTSRPAAEHARFLFGRITNQYSPMAAFGGVGGPVAISALHHCIDMGTHGTPACQGTPPPGGPHPPGPGPGPGGPDHGPPGGPPPPGPHGPHGTPAC